VKVDKRAFLIDTLLRLFLYSSLSRSEGWGEKIEIAGWMIGRE